MKPGPWLLCLLVVPHAVAMPCRRRAGAASDALALVQRGVEHHTPAFSPKLVKTAVQALAKRVDEQLRKHEVQLELERQRASAMNRYVDKLRATLGRKGTLFGDLVGLLPMGHMDEADRRLGLALLGLLRERRFAAAVHQAIQGLESSLAQYSTRSERRVQDLVVKSANASEAELPGLLKHFFRNQQHLLSAVLAAAEAGLRGLVAALPPELQPATGALGPLVDRLVGQGAQLLANNTELAVASRGAKFCGGLDLMLTEELLPLVNHTVSAMPVIEGFAASQAPDVAQEVSQMVRELSGMSRSVLSALRRDASSWTEKICGLVGAALVQ